MHVGSLPALGVLLALMLAASETATVAQAVARAPGTAAVDCRGAAQMFGHAAGLPAGLLLAIGQVESGRPDPLTGRVEPWPWTTNHAGEGHHFTSAQEAIAWV